MRGVALCIGAALALGIMLLFAQAEEQFRLHRQEVRDVSYPLVTAGRGYYGAGAGKPDLLKGGPKDAAEALEYYSIPLQGRAVLFALEWGRRPRLWADTDGDRDLSDEQAYEGRAVARQGEGFLRRLGRALRRSDPEEVGFGPLSLSFQGGPATEVAVQVRELSRGHPSLMARPAALRAGTVKFGARSCAVALVDLTLDGRYDGYFTSGWGYGSDRLAIDLDGDGQFAPGYPASREVMPLPHMLAVEGRYYSLQPAADGFSLRVAEVTPEFGTLDVGAAGAQLALLSDSGYHELAAAGAPWKLPAGRYSAVSVVLRQKDQKGGEWALSCYGQTGKLQDFSIKPGEPTVIEVGPPLLGVVELDQAPGEVTLGYSLQGRADEVYAAGAFRDEEQQPPPGFKILDEGGKALESGSFEYG